MDTKLKRSTTFHPQTYGQTKVVNMTLVQLQRGYNQKHPKIWDENLVYMQHSYNKAVHTSTGKSPFETCFGYLSPSPLDITYGQQGGVKKDIIGDALRAENFIEKIKHIHLQVKETLQKSQVKYKARHDRNRTKKSFKVGDRVWL